ncbi:hypothetical protein ACWDAO_39810 [Streptomyces sp. NPDC001212]
MLSPYSKVNKVDHTLTDQAFITWFPEDNWYTGRLGDHSFDATAGWSSTAVCGGAART